jgi:uncharacterized membrane protein YvbJ
MVKMCECCRNLTHENSAAFCMHCGNKFPEDECVLLRKILDSVEESQREIQNIRILIRRSQKKPKLAKNLLYAIIGIILIVTVVIVLFFQLGTRPYF